MGCNGGRGTTDALSHTLRSRLSCTHTDTHRGSVVASPTRRRVSACIMTRVVRERINRETYGRREHELMRACVCV